MERGWGGTHDPGVFARTQAIGQVKLARAGGGGGGAVITWNPLPVSGVTYELVRSRVPSNFATHPTATCLDPGGIETQYTDLPVPARRHLLLRRARTERVRAITDSTGAVVEQYAYDDWGNPSFFTGGGTPLPFSIAGNPFLYRGMVWEPETQLYRLGATAYDPHIGRPIRCPSGLCRTSSAAGAMTPFGGEPPPVASSTPVIHWTLEVRVDRIEMK